MGDARGAERLAGVTRSRPCPVCRGTHKCSVGDGGLILCGRERGAVQGFVHLGPGRRDGQWHCYRADGSDGGWRVPQRSGRKGKKKSRPADAQAAPGEWRERAEGFAATLTPNGRGELAKALKLPLAALNLLPLLGATRDDGGPCWTLPEEDGAGNVVGVHRRYFATGEKKRMAGAGCGLTVPSGWADRPGPVLAVEGASDALACAAAGLASVGRPNNTAGAEYLAELLRGLPADRPVIVVGENDQKPRSKKHPAGLWPGREGAEAVAAKVAAMLGRPVKVSLPPDGAKDCRAWLHAQKLDQRSPAAAWEESGRKLLAALAAAAYDPPPADDLPAPPGGNDGGGGDGAGEGGTPPGPRVQVLVTDREFEVNDAVALAVASDGDIYARAGDLVRVVEEPAAERQNIRTPAGPRIAPLSHATLREYASRRCEFVQDKPVGKGRTARLPVHPPEWAVAAVKDRGAWPGSRRLQMVLDYPVLRPDGSVLSSPGYDPGTGLYLAYEPVPLPVPDRPTRDDARRAAAELLDAACDFPFVTDAHRAAWLAGVLTPTARFAFAGPSPMFLADGNIRGAGKGLLIDVGGIIASGREFATTGFTLNDDEMRKRITCIAVEGDRLVLLDNIDGKFGGPSLDRALTSVWWKDRVLGLTKQAEAPLLAVWCGTGNNVQAVGDTARRICRIRIESADEHPEDRSDFRHRDLRSWVRAERPRLLAASLTLLRAYCLAGRPAPTLRAWGSYEGWSEMVRGAVVWSGCADPGDTRDDLRAESDLPAVAMATIVRNWHNVDPYGRGLTVAQFLQAVFPKYGETPDLLAEVAEAVDSLVTKRDAGMLGYKFRHYRKRRYGNRVWDLVGMSSGAKRWAAVPAEAAAKTEEL